MLLTIWTWHRRTKEGYRIFSEDELKINKGGGTEQCPFDCDCCF